MTSKHKYSMLDNSVSQIILYMRNFFFNKTGTCLSFFYSLSIKLLSNRTDIIHHFRYHLANLILH